MVVLVALLVTDILITTSTNERIRAHEEEKARIVSKTVAKSSIVIESLLAEEQAEALQVYTSDVQAITEMLFVVVMDIEGIRYTHPDPTKIGQFFAGGDEQAVFQGKAYVSISEGTLGESLRAFTPVYDDNDNQIGAVAVGVSLESVTLALAQNHRSIIGGTLLGLLVGLIGAVLLAKYIKHTLFNLEPYEISKLLEERNAMLNSVHEGIIAVDQHQKITLVNEAAIRIFKKAGISGHPTGMRITDYIPGTTLERVMKTKEAVHNDEQSLNGVAIVTNSEPLVVDNQVIGSIATFRDKTEVNELAKQLTGVKTYVEALRSQSHEFKNRLHVIFGMVQIEAYDELAVFIRKIVELTSEEELSISKSIKDPVLAGFLMGKMSYAREKNVRFKIAKDTTITEEIHIEVVKALITIIGNLVDNAIEALAYSNEKEIELRIKTINESLQIIVADSGPGIACTNLEQIFDKGYSTKGPNRGFGLYLIKQNIEKLKGDFSIETNENGTVFEVILPYETTTERGSI